MPEPTDTAENDHLTGSSITESDSFSSELTPKNPDPDAKATNSKKAGKDTGRQKEFGGQKGPEPTRYGDWEKNGRCTDF